MLESFTWISVFLWSRLSPAGCTGFCYSEGNLIAISPSIYH